MKKRAGKSNFGRLERALPRAIGVCVKDSNQRVQFQNDKCIEVCGELAGEICQKTCMRTFVHDLGTRVELGITAEDGAGNTRPIDAVVINDGHSITTIFSPIPEKLLEARAAIKDCKLSPSQQRVCDLVLQGRSNQEIANTLFISVPTVRTHLTRIYEKIPKDLLQLILSGSTRIPSAK